MMAQTYNTVVRERTMVTQTWMGVPEAEVRMEEGTHDDTKSRVLCAGCCVHRERRGPLLFIGKVELMSRKIGA